MTHDWITPVPVTTTGLTPAVVTIATIPADGTAKLMLTVVARGSDGTSATWQATRTFKRTGLGALGMIGSLIAPTIERDAGALTWTISIGVSDGTITVTVTGALGTTVTWKIQAELVT